MWFPVPMNIKSGVWCVTLAVVCVMAVVEVTALSGPNVCMVKQKYNITKRVKYRAPMSVRSYEWCFSMPPRCSKWSTEMRDLTRLETEERIAEVAVCCPGYKMKDVACVPMCTNGKTGPGCNEDCPPNKWGPNCVHTCKKCKNGFCSRLTGECECVDGWQGESCDIGIPPITAISSLGELLTTLSTKTISVNTTPRTTTSSTVITSPKPKLTAKNMSTTEIVATLPGIDVTPNVETSISTEITTISPKFKTVIIPSTSSSSTVTEMASTLRTISNNREKVVTPRTISYISTTGGPISTKIFYNSTYVTTSTARYNHTTSGPDNYWHMKETKIVKTAENTTVSPIQNITDVSVQKISKEATIVTKVLPTTTFFPLTNESFHTEIPSKEPTTIRITPSTTKLIHKEIWIRPAQKGEVPIADTKIKTAHDFPRYRSANNKELTLTSTPKTIIVSIIPTSVSYASFKRIALTSSYLANKNSTNAPSYNITDQGSITMPISAVTSKPQKNLNLSTKETTLMTPYVETTTFLSSTSVTSNITSTKAVTKPVEVTKTILPNNVTNSMITGFNTSTFTPIIATSPKISTKDHDSPGTRSNINLKTSLHLTTEKTTREFLEQITPRILANVSLKFAQPNDTNFSTINEKEIKTVNITKILTTTTDGPMDDEEFHILTEPEHITAVMGDKNTNRQSVDLISVIGIAGGVMMAVITVAVIIVMIERCKKPRYEDVRKINDIRMQVMIDNSDAPPPYVRSIFHTPLPEPPTSDRCHYQPISTLDRNLKQFMRPVVVQTISPIMLENFREILECHYDHLPRRSHEFEAMQVRSSLLPSMKDHNALQQLRASMTESTIESLKCEARLDVIDSTTSEPLYAEIPCWRPPSEHAVEILNLNGEAVTEL